MTLVTPLIHFVSPRRTQVGAELMDRSLCYLARLDRHDTLLSLSKQDVAIEHGLNSSGKKKIEILFHGVIHQILACDKTDGKKSLKSPQLCQTFSK